MSAPLVERLLGEVRASPGKAALLVIGFVVVLVVWVPRMAGGDKATGGSATTASSPDPGAGSLVSEAPRMPHQIRAEFINILKEAKALRGLADPIDVRPVERDPFARPPGLESPEPSPAPVIEATPPDAPETLPDFGLTAVVQFPSGPSAVIDGKVVRVGDVIEGFSVVEILPRLVRLRGPRAVHELKMLRGRTP